MRSKKTLILAIVIVGLALLVGATLRTAEAIEDLSSDAYSSLKLFSRALAVIESKYVEEVEMKKLVYGAIHGMLQTLDPHSAFLEPDFFKELTVDTTGQFGGLGIEISIKDGYIAVIAPIDGTPAAEAGIQAGDLIVKIEGKTTKGMNLMDAVKLLRGEPGSKVTISVWRKGLVKPDPVTITRAVIKVESVKHHALEPGYGYIKLSQFNANTARNLEKSLRTLAADPAGLQGLVLDLRNNPGGLLDQAGKVADKFISSGLIVYTKGRIPTQDLRLSASKAGTHPNFPMVVIINSGSASASEIVAGALQDHKRAIIVGKPSFGKGSVQTILRLDDGSGIKLTTSKYFTPNGRDIQAKGIEPDFMVSGTVWDGMDPNKVEFYKEREKDLQNRLKNDDEMEAPPEIMPDEEQIMVPDEDGKKMDKIKDQQLDLALSLLKSWGVFKNVAQ